MCVCMHIVYIYYFKNPSDAVESFSYKSYANPSFKPKTFGEADTLRCNVLIDESFHFEKPTTIIYLYLQYTQSTLTHTHPLSGR